MARFHGYLDKLLGLLFIEYSGVLFKSIVRAQQDVRAMRIPCLFHVARVVTFYNTDEEIPNRRTVAKILGTTESRPAGQTAR